MTNTNIQNTTSERFPFKTSEELVAEMQEEERNAERERILAKMTPALRTKLTSIKNWMNKEMDHLLRSRYALGLEVLELYEDEKKNNGKVYGKNAIGRICKLLDWDDGLIRMTLRFVLTFNKEDLERLCGLVLQGGQPLSWSHVRTILQVRNANERQELLDKTVAEGWTSYDLANAIVTSGNGKEGDGRGRPPRVPNTFDGALTQQLTTAQHWDRMHTKVWARAERSLEAQAAKLSPDEVTDERWCEAKDLAFRLRRVAEQATAQAEEAEQVVREFERILDERLKGKQESAIRPSGKAGKAISVENVG